MSIETTVSIDLQHLQVDTSDTVVTTEQEYQIVQSEDQTVVVSPEQEIFLIVSGSQGPAGLNGQNGTWEDEVPMSKKVDFVGDTIIYIGRAVPGTDAGTSLWQISRTTLAPDDDVVVEWAAGNANYDKKWNDRLTLTYS
jgi:hypothetical protein